MEHKSPQHKCLSKLILTRMTIVKNLEKIEQVTVIFLQHSFQDFITPKPVFLNIYASFFMTERDRQTEKDEEGDV